MNVCLSVCMCVLNGWTDSYDSFCVQWLSGSRDNLYSQSSPVGPTRGGARTGNLRFTVDISAYKWLLLVIGDISIYYLLVAIG